jgi:hypothetical protein
LQLSVIVETQDIFRRWILVSELLDYRWPCIPP